MMHYDGDGWREVAWSKPLPLLNDVWGSSADDVFVVGYGGTILHYDGADWESMVSGTSAALLSLWGTGPNDVYAVGENGTLLHYDGLRWLPMRSGTAAFFYDLWGDASSNSLVVVGSTGQFVNKGAVYHMTYLR
jgi:photosystem II stability/assembly factor-like uncharacterized protein